MRIAEIAYLLSAVGLVACSSKPEPVRLELPIASEPDAGSAIFSFHATGQSDRLELLDLDRLDPSLLELPVVDPYDDGVTIESEILFYAASPEELGLTPGPLMPLENAGTEIQYLATDKFLSARALELLPDDEAPSWKYADSLEGLELSTVRLDFAPCVRWRPTNAKVFACRHVSFLLATGPKTAIFGTHDQRFWEINVSNPTVPTPVASPLGLAVRPPATDVQCAMEGTTSTSSLSVPLEQRIYSGTGDPNTHAWYGGFGTVHYVASGQPPVTVDLSIPGEVRYQRGIEWVAGQPDPGAADFEIYAMSSIGWVFRITKSGTGFEVEKIYDFGIADAVDVQVYGGIAHPGPGKLVAAHGSAFNVLYYNRALAPANRADSSRRPTEDQGHSAAAHIPGIGSLVAGEQARIAVHDETTNTWKPLEVTGDWKSRIESIGAFGDGFVFGGTNGFMAQYLPGPGFCRTEQLAPHTPRYLLELEDTLIAMGAKPGDKNEAVFSVLAYE